MKDDKDINVIAFYTHPHKNMKLNMIMTKIFDIQESNISYFDFNRSC